MMGEKTLSDTKTEIRAAFAKKGIDVETWLDQQMAKIRRRPPSERAALESIRLVREGLRSTSKTQQVGKRKAKKTNGKKKPAA